MFRTVYVDVPASAYMSKVPKAPRVHATTTTEQPKIGPPGGKWKWQKRAERDAAARPSTTMDMPSDTPSQSMPTTPTPTARTFAFVTASAASPDPNDMEPLATDRILADKGVGTECPPLDRLEFLRMLKMLVLRIQEEIRTEESRI